MLYLHLVSAVRPSRFSSYCIDFIPIEVMGVIGIEESLGIV